MPYERIVLLAFASAGAVATGLVSIFAWWVAGRAIKSRLIQILAVAISAWFFAIGWADGIAHLGKQLFVGPCNPFDAACNGEFEGWTGPTSASEVPAWRARRCGPPPGGNGHPIMPWWGNPSTGTWCMTRD